MPHVEKQMKVRAPFRSRGASSAAEEDRGSGFRV